MQRQTMTVSELNGYIKSGIELDPMLRDLSVAGELSNYKIYPSGHHYFTLKDAESSLRCVMFKGSASKLRYRPESGMKVIASGRVEVYLRDGAYQLICSSLLPEGSGDLQVAFEQLKKKLSEEGLFDRQYKKPLPRFPRRIALITSSAGAAVHDMIRILGQRWPMCKVLLLPVRVQGTEAPPEIAGAIRYANEFDLADLIITGRGGGSIEDLWAFNDERVARAIFASKIPVISAVGHEPDVTIADYVADLRAATPSNAAELAVPDQNKIRDALDSLDIRSRQAVRKKIQALKQRLDGLREKRVLSDPEAMVNDRRIGLDHMRDRLLSAEEKNLSRGRERFVQLAASLDALSPLRVLARGYSIAQNARGLPLRSVRELTQGERFRLMMSDGTIDCRTETIREGEQEYGAEQTGL